MDPYVKQYIVTRLTEEYGISEEIAEAAVSVNQTDDV